MKRNMNHTARSLIMISGMICASTASAQLVVDTTPEAELHEHIEHDEHVSNLWVKKVHDNGHVYVLEVKDGVFEVRIDNKDIPMSWVNKDGDMVKVINDHGKELYEFKIDMHPKAATWVMAPRVNGRVNNQVAHGWSSHNGGPVGTIEVDVDFEQPTVMLGISMSEPSDALRKHLRIGSDREVIMVERVMKGLPAAKSGMEQYDIILSINGSDEANGEILHEVLMEQEAGDTLKIVVLRSGDKITLKPKLVEFDTAKMGSKNFPTRTVRGTITDSFTSDNGVVQIQVHENLEDQAGKKVAVLRHEMMERAKDAMAQAEQQVLELRDGQLFIHQNNIKELQHKIQGMKELELLQGLNLHDLRDISSDRLEGLEGRLNALEERLEIQSEKLENRMKQITDLLERMFEKLSEDED